MKWIIYYGDGSTYSNQDGNAWDAPNVNVQMVVCYTPNRRLFFGKDYFYYRPDLDQWWPADWNGCLDYLRDSGPKKILFGRNLRDEDYYAILERARREHPK